MRTIDGPERRRRLAEAVWRVIRREGFDGASVRAVAAETGLSTGSVRHFFATQDELHVFAMEELIRDTAERATTAARTGTTSTERAERAERAEPGAAGGAGPAPRDRVRAALAELLPLTDDTAALYRAHLEFVLRATVNPALAPVARRTYDELQSFYRQLLQLLVDVGDAPAGLDATATVDELAALVDGLVLRGLAAPHLLDRRGTMGVVDRFLDRLASQAQA